MGIEDILSSWGNETVRIIQANLSSTGTNASGQTSDSVKSVSTSNSVQVSGQAFIYVVETGRQPGKMPPVSKLIEWLQYGKMRFSGTIESAAWGISKKIAEKGSSLFRSGGRKDIITPAISDERVNELTKEIADFSFKKTINVIETGIN